MSHFHRSPIVVPTDFSAPSLQAVRTARTVTEDDDQITVVHIACDAGIAAPPFGWSGEFRQDEYVAGTSEKLQNWIAENGLGNVNAVVRCGDPGLEVCAVAEASGAKLIVVPSHGRSGMERVLLGSVAERIIRHAECSVLVLRRSIDGCQSVIADSWCPRHRVVVPVDFSESTERALAVAKELVDGREEVDVLHVVPHFEDILIGKKLLTEEIRVESRQSELEQYLAEHGHTGMRAHALAGDPGTTICDYVNEVGADTVVIPSHGYQSLDRLIIGSKAERVIRHCTVPVLVLRRHDAE